MGQIFQVLVRPRILALFLSEAALVATCYVGASYLILQEEWEVFLTVEFGLAQIAITTACVLLAAYFVGLYDNIRAHSKVYLVQQICLSLGIALVAQAVILYARVEAGLPRGVMLVGSAACVILFPAWRLLYTWLILRSLLMEQILFLGASSVVLQLAKYLTEHPESGFRCLGCLVPEGQTGPEIPGIPTAPLARLREMVRELKPDQVVVGLAERREVLPIGDLLDLRFQGVRIEEVASVYERVFQRVCIHELRPAQLIFSSTLGPRRQRPQLQALGSILFAGLVLLLSWPLMILAVLAIKLGSPGPVLFRQTRIGLWERPFTIYKFRSMRTDAEAATGAVWAKDGDPRVTGVGRWLRLLRIDELPQLFNVLKGEMAIVGPRPERPEFVSVLKEQIPFYGQRHSVKPGITGWAQINYKYGSSFEDAARKLEFDLYYIKNVSTALDLYVAFHTFRTMLTGHGAQ